MLRVNLLATSLDIFICSRQLYCNNHQTFKKIVHTIHIAPSTCNRHWGLIIPIHWIQSMFLSVAGCLMCDQDMKVIYIWMKSTCGYLWINWTCKFTCMYVLHCCRKGWPVCPKSCLQQNVDFDYGKGTCYCAFHLLVRWHMKHLCSAVYLLAPVQGNSTLNMIFSVTNSNCLTQY